MSAISFRMNRHKMTAKKETKTTDVSFYFVCFSLPNKKCFDTIIFVVMYMKVLTNLFTTCHASHFIGILTQQLFVDLFFHKSTNKYRYKYLKCEKALSILLYFTVYEQNHNKNCHKSNCVGNLSLYLARYLLGQSREILSHYIPVETV